MNSAVDPGNRVVKSGQASGKAHSTINSNIGTVIPGTTSGTLNSTVNPNTQFVIPIHKSKKKGNPNSNASPGSGIITPNKIITARIRVHSP